MNRRRKTEGMVICKLLTLGFLLAPADRAGADFAFGTPTNLGPLINTPLHETDPGLSRDGLRLYVAQWTLDWSGNPEIWIAQRVTEDDPWDDLASLGPWVLTAAGTTASTEVFVEAMGEIPLGWGTADDLETYISSDSLGGYGGIDLFVVKRETVDAEWGPPLNLGPSVNTENNDIWGPISPDGLTLHFSSFGRPDGYGRSDLYVTTRETRSDPWGIATNLGPNINSPSWDILPIFSPDGLQLFFVSGRTGGSGGDDLWMARRVSPSDPWEAAVNLGPVINTAADDTSPYVLADGSALYFASNRSGGYGGSDIWQVPIVPILDFNGNGRVDINDLLTLIEHWGQNDPSVDIGPMPWGDGIIDGADLEVLMRHWEQDVYDPHLLAHWPLDEAEGMFAADSVGDNDGMVLGDPVWQPSGGQVGGALAFDGIDDLVVVKPVLDPAEGPFSVFAWVQGGQSGQVVISQQKGADWLMADSDGKLMTDLNSTGRISTSLCSETIITDGNWHRIGLVWDGFQRALYVDDMLVAMDTQTGLGSSSGGLAIGVARDNQVGSFWSGMIDDVRIYSRVVEP